MAEKEVDFKEYVGMLLKYKYLVCGILIAFLGMGFIFYKLEVPFYSSTSKLVLDTESYETRYNIKSKQDAGIISSKARSYEIVLQAVVDLDLLNHPIKPEIGDIVISKIKGAIPFIKEKSRDKMSIREVVQYYQGKISTKTESRGQIVSIEVIAQDPKISSKLSNRVGEILIERNLEEKNSKIKKTLAYIENQIDSVDVLLKANRRVSEENEMSPQYIDILRLEDQIFSLTDTLNMLVGQKEHLNTMDILTYDFYSDMQTLDDETYQKKKVEVDRKKEEIMLQKTYIDARIVEVRNDLERLKEELRTANKTEYYIVQDMEFAIQTDQDIMTNLLGEKQSIQLADLIASKDLKFLSRAYEPVWPDKTKGLTYLLVFFMIGSGVSFGSMIILNFFDKRFKSADDLENTLNLDVMGVIPKIKKDEEIKLLSPNEHPKSIVIESYRTLRTNLNFEKRDNNIKTLTITSAKPDEGKTMTILNLASVMADSGDKVLVLDADLRNPAIHKNARIKRKPGLTEVLSGKSRLSSSMKKIKNNMYILPVGSLVYNPQKILGSKQMDKLLKDAAAKFDYVLCDSIPALAMSDADILSSKTDGTIMVMDQKRTVKQEVEDVKNKLLKINANIVGVVINKNKNKRRKYNFYYGK